MVRVVRSRVEIEGRVHEETVIVEGEEPAPWEASASLRTVGQATPRVDGRERVTGTARYTYDVQLPGMIYAAVLRSPHPHARITQLDTGAAQALPGVRAVLSHQNAPPINWYGKVSKLFDPTLRHVGEEVAAVAADSLDIARAALALIQVEYETLPYVLDPEAAMASGAPQVHPAGNVLLEDGQPGDRYSRGDVAHGLNDADVVVEGTWRTAAQMHNSLETHGCVAAWEGDNLTLYESTQYIYGVRSRVAEALGISQNKIHVIENYMGGGFGSKASTRKQTVIAALLARAAGRPVHLMLDRREENLVTGYRSPSIQRIKIGAQRDGTLTAIQLDGICEIGAYGAWAPAVAGPFKELYACPNVQTTVLGVRTNTDTMAAFRAPGYLEGTVGLEGALDELAKRLEMDPLELRLKNYAEHNPLGDANYTSKHLRACYERGAAMFDWEGRRAAVRADREANPGAHLRRGVGLASQVWGGGGGPPTQALVRLNSDGTMDVYSGTQDIGTGTRTVMAQIAAEALGFALDQVRMHLGDTASGPYGGVSGGSSTVPSVGPAVRMAAEEARQQLLQIAATFMDTSSDKLDIRDGYVVRQNDPDRRMALKDVFEEIGDYQIIGKGFRGPNPNAPINTWGVQFCEVEVDTITGRVRVVRIVAVHDIGRAVNPLTLRNQFEGGIIQGLGLALTEERVIDPQTGIPLNPDLEGYKLPTIADLPQIDVAWIGEPDTVANHLGVKGAGEPPIIPTAAAIANAVADALGTRLYELPLTPARVLAAWHEGR
jgi:xanthine dehydrogenase YagR molybdenum-binding subunit